MNKEHAQLRATEIKANNAAARHAVEQAKAAEISPVMADPLVDAAVAEATKAVHQTRELHDHLLGQKLVGAQSRAVIVDRAVDHELIGPCVRDKILQLALHGLRRTDE